MLRLHEYRYHRPTSLSGALELLGDHPDAMPIAGGTDLMPNMKHGLWTPHHLVALKKIRELNGISVAEDADRPDDERGEIIIGAAETLNTVAAHPAVRSYLPSLAAAAGLVAGPQIRNQGTIGGNVCLDTRCTYYNQSHFWRHALGYCLKKDGDICHVTKVGKKCVAAHSADTATVLISLGASLELVSPAAVRTVPASDFFIADGEWNTVRRRDEILTRIRVPMPGPGSHFAYRKLRQRGSIDFPLLSIAVAANLAGDSTVTSLTVVVSGLGSRPRVVSGLDKIAVGEPLEKVVDAVARQAHKQSHPLENMIVDAKWRRAMVPVYVRRALEEIAS
jgi:4-hydroxybenzoyl-CoA reductase subunit beta